MGSRLRVYYSNYCKIITVKVPFYGKTFECKLYPFSWPQTAPQWYPQPIHVCELSLLKELVKQVFQKLPRKLASLAYPVFQKSSSKDGTHQLAIGIQPRDTEEGPEPLRFERIKIWV